ncbi:hypothetical protein NQ318_001615 [Aromia moschata]|uniref:Uncharacterized protein n=1 Tax=Aromia moschata TaxID=1265417 RepID=A0AAV8Y1Q7_9CUCU|nr:hypothetical protein NQ318_001615 [Aromia moschata]
MSEQEEVEEGQLKLKSGNPHLQKIFKQNRILPFKPKFRHTLEEVMKPNVWILFGDGQQSLNAVGFHKRILFSDESFQQTASFPLSIAGIGFLNGLNGLKRDVKRPKTIRAPDGPQRQKRTKILKKLVNESAKIVV